MTRISRRFPSDLLARTPRQVVAVGPLDLHTQLIPEFLSPAPRQGVAMAPVAMTPAAPGQGVAITPPNP